MRNWGNTTVTGHAKRRHSRHKRKVKRQTKCPRFAKLKELQADSPAKDFAAHLIMPERTWTLRTVDKISQTDN
jgi:hypothetical protein